MTLLTIAPDEHCGTKQAGELSLAVINRGDQDEIVVWGLGDIFARVGERLLRPSGENRFQRSFRVDAHRNIPVAINAA